MCVFLAVFLVPVMEVQVTVKVMLLGCVCVSSEAHLTVLVLNLMTMKLRDFRKDIDIADDQLYERCLRDDIISAEVGLVEIYS